MCPGRAGCDDSDTDERDPATWEAAASHARVQADRLRAKLVERHRDGLIPEEVVGLGSVLYQATTVDMLRAVEASRWQRDAAQQRDDAERIQRELDAMRWSCRVFAAVGAFFFLVVFIALAALFVKVG